MLWARRNRQPGWARGGELVAPLAHADLLSLDTTGGGLLATGDGSTVKQLRSPCRGCKVSLIGGLDDRIDHESPFEERLATLFSTMTRLRVHSRAVYRNHL